MEAMRNGYSRERVSNHVHDAVIQRNDEIGGVSDEIQRAHEGRRLQKHGGKQSVDDLSKEVFDSTGGLGERVDAETKRRSLEGKRDERVQLDGEEEVDGMDSTIADEKIGRRRRADGDFERRRRNRRAMAIERREGEKGREGREKRREMLVGHIYPHVGKREIEKQHASIR